MQEKGFAALTIEKAMMNSEIGFGRKVLEVFEKHGISFEHMPSGIDTMTIFVQQDAFEEHEQQVIAGIHRAVEPDEIVLESDLALISRGRPGNEADPGHGGTHLFRSCPRPHQREND